MLRMQLCRETDTSWFQPLCMAWVGTGVPAVTQGHGTQGRHGLVLASTAMVPGCLNLSSLHWQYVSEQLQAHKQLVVSTCSVADIQAAFNTTVSRIQR